MDVSAGIVHQTPGAPLATLDPSVQTDSGIATNTLVPSNTRILNPSAIALDNPAGTGAAFDKKDSIYNIYQRWPEKSTVINGSLSAGAELVRISLNPMTLPLRLKEWALFHRSCIPSIDVGIVIGGAAGTISWLAIGWIADDQQSVSLDDLQQVSCEHINMNTTIVTRFILNDNRRMGMYRTLPDDTEKWPAMVILVNHPALNVQRNNDVNYPIDIYVRYSPMAKFFEPFNLVSSGGEIERRIDLRPFLKLENVDLLIGESLVCNPLVDTIEVPDAGWNTGSFAPTFPKENLMCMRSDAIFDVPRTSILCWEDATLDWARAAQAIRDAGRWTQPRAGIPLSVCYAWGEVPKALKDASWDNNHPFPHSGWNGTSYTIEPLTIVYGSIKYTGTTMMVWEFGCAIVFNVKYETHSEGFDVNMIAYKCLEPGELQIQKVGVCVSGTDNKDTVVGDLWYQDGSAESVNYFIVNYPFQKLKNQGYQRPYTQNVTPYISSRFYEWSYVQTSNNALAAQLPAGLKTISICRPGTTSTVTTNSPFFPIMAPDLRGAKSLLDRLCKQLETTWLEFEIEIDGFAFGTGVYSDSVMAIRTAEHRAIKTGVSNHLVANNIRAISQPTNITDFNTQGFAPWTQKAAFEGSRPRFSLMHMQRQSFAGFALAGGASMLNGIFDYYKMFEQRQWMDEYQKRQLDAQRSLSDNLQTLKNQGQLDLQQKAFDQKMLLLGKNSISAQTGGLQQLSTGTAGTQTDSPSVPPRPNVEGPLVPASLGARTPTPFKQAELLSSNKLSEVAPGSENPLEKVEQLEKMWEPTGDSQQPARSEPVSPPGTIGPSPGYISFPQGGHPPPSPSELMGNRANAMPSAVPDQALRPYMDYYTNVPKGAYKQLATTSAPENIGPSINAGGISSFKSAGPTNNAAYRAPFNEAVTSFSHEPAPPSHPLVPHPELSAFSGIPRPQLNSMQQLSDDPSSMHFRLNRSLHDERGEATILNSRLASPLQSAPVDQAAVQAGLPIQSVANGNSFVSSHEMSTRF